VQQLIFHQQKHSRFYFLYLHKSIFFRNFYRPLWIDSLYGSNNSNLPSIYDESYARIRRSNAATTNDCHSPTLVAPLLPPTQKSNDQIDEITKYSLTDVILQGSNLQNTCISHSKLCEQKQITKKHEQKNSIRRVQSDFNLLSINNDLTPSDMTQSSLSNNNRLNKKSKSMIDNLDKIRSKTNQENTPSAEKNEQIIENKSVGFFNESVNIMKIFHLIPHGLVINSLPNIRYASRVVSHIPKFGNEVISGWRDAHPLHLMPHLPQEMLRHIQNSGQVPLPYST
jgi:hypothetical protein